MIATVGLIATRSVENILIAQIDRTLVGFMDRGPIFRTFPVPGPESVPGPEEVQAGEELLRPIAEVLVDANGTILDRPPFGIQRRPGSLA